MGYLPSDNTTGVATAFRLIYNPNTSSYPPRPTTLAGGSVIYIGPVVPTDWLVNDLWINNS